MPAMIDKEPARWSEHNAFEISQIDKGVFVCEIIQSKSIIRRQPLAVLYLHI